MKNIFRKPSQWGFISLVKIQKQLLLIFLMGFLTACSDFVEVDLPKQLVTSQTVFDNPSTTEAVLKNIYAIMRTGSPTAADFTFFMGLYTDELDYYDTNQSFLNFQNHIVLPNQSQIASWWAVAYNLIYEANALIESVEVSASLTLEDRDQFMGEALFVRAYLHFMLVELYGDIPYITTTDYITNTTVSRMPRSLVYEHIIEDLDLAQGLLSEEDISGEKTRPYRAVAHALLARVHLYNQDWELAEATATEVIVAFGGLELDLDKVFLEGSSETIWQFKPRSDGENTNEGVNLILLLDPVFFNTGGMPLTRNLSEAFEPGDKRQDHWTGEVRSFTTPEPWRFAFKYKERGSTGTSLEYPIQFRLAEQYLIRAEAIARQENDIPGTQADINTIRSRAGLGNTSAITLNGLLDAILQERQVELFTEHGHRWFDLKRLEKAKEVLEPIKSGWRDTDVLLPIPESELLLNPNLLPQNNGY